jgi:hypothetical protein
MYVDWQQFAAVLLHYLPLFSTLTAISMGNAMENSGKQNPKTGFKSPTEQRRKSSRPQEITLSIDLPTNPQMVVQIDSVAFCQFTS